MMMVLLLICLLYSIISLVQSLELSTRTLLTKPDETPNWNAQFWTPIESRMSSKDPLVRLCKLDFKSHYESPHTTPMFKDLVAISRCGKSISKDVKMSVLLEEINQTKGTLDGNVITPTGFVFHESRVGSTLIANLLASDPFNLVFSESTPIASAINHCPGCSHERHIQLIRNIATLMGRSPIHKRLFFKFQSITSTNIQIVLEAFPDTPWVFVYRNPVQTMMSHLDPKRSINDEAPCLRSRKRPPHVVSNAVKAATDVTSLSHAPAEAWCAARLNMLCISALKAYEHYGTYHNSTLSGTSGSDLSVRANNSTQRGLLLNYETLPGAIATLIFPLFNTALTSDGLKRIHTESTQYSKSRNSRRSRTFLGDSTDKMERATATIEKYAYSILGETYTELNRNAVSGVKNISPQIYSSIVRGIGSSSVSGGSKIKSDSINEIEDNWSSLKELPTVLN